MIFIGKPAQLFRIVKARFEVPLINVGGWPRLAPLSLNHLEQIVSEFASLESRDCAWRDQRKREKEIYTGISCSI